jgi:outer membrane lipoprotein SlyB
MKKLFAIAIAAVLLLSGCAVPSRSGDAYSRGEALNVMSVRMGTLEAARMVKLEGTHSGAGMIAGGAIGGIAGSAIGGGKGKKLATILGVLAGASVGAAMEQSSSSSQGLELIVRMDNGELIAVVQQLSNEAFSNGQRVRVVSNGRQVRVTSV